jgi:hypothetical protein
LGLRLIQTSLKALELIEEIANNSLMAVSLCFNPPRDIHSVMLVQLGLMLMGNDDFTFIWQI